MCTSGCSFWNYLAHILSLTEVVTGHHHMVHEHEHSMQHMMPADILWVHRHVCHNQQHPAPYSERHRCFPITECYSHLTTPTGCIARHVRGSGYYCCSPFCCCSCCCSPFCCCSSSFGDSGMGGSTPSSSGIYSTATSHLRTVHNHTNLSQHMEYACCNSTAHQLRIM